MSKLVPSYRRHKNGHAFIRCSRINGGRNLYLGRWGTPESRDKYQQVLKRLSLAEQAPLARPVLTPTRDKDRSIIGVVDRYTDYAKTRYSTADGPTKEYAEMLTALNPLVAVFGDLDATEFTPGHLIAVQEYMLGLGTLCRQVINRRVSRIKRMFRWASQFKEVPYLLYWELKCVEPVPYGRGYEAEPVEPVPLTVVEATLPWLSPIVATMVQEQLLCGMRPQDVCRMRPADVDKSPGDVWIYKPLKHKLSHRGKPRFIAIPPFAQELLAPLLDRDPESHCFDPRESYAWLRRHQADANRAKRKTPIYPCELRKRATRQRIGPPLKRTRQAAFNTDSYRKAIQDGISRAAAAGVEIPHWHPHQLRHTISTAVSQELGEQEAQRLLGHERLETTGIYTQRQIKELVDIARRLAKSWPGSGLASMMAGCSEPPAAS